MCNDRIYYLIIFFIHQINGRHHYKKFGWDIVFGQKNQKHAVQINRIKSFAEVDKVDVLKICFSFPTDVENLIQMHPQLLELSY